MDTRSIKVYRLSPVVGGRPEDELPVEMVDYILNVEDIVSNCRNVIVKRVQLILLRWPCSG